MINLDEELSQEHLERISEDESCGETDPKVFFAMVSMFAVAVLGALVYELSKLI